MPMDTKTEQIASQDVEVVSPERKDKKKRSSLEKKERRKTRKERKERRRQKRKEKEERRSKKEGAEKPTMKVVVSYEDNYNGYQSSDDEGTATSASTCKTAPKPRTAEEMNQVQLLINKTLRKSALDIPEKGASKRSKCKKRRRKYKRNLFGARKAGSDTFSCASGGDASSSVSFVSPTFKTPAQEGDMSVSLHEACRLGFITNVQRLLEQGVSAELLNAKDPSPNDKSKKKVKRGDTPIALAAINGHIGIVQLLMKHGAKVSAESGGTDGQTALHRYAKCYIGPKKRTVNICIQLLKGDCDVNTKTGRGMTPLMYACLHGQIGVCVALCHMRADPRIQREDKATAIHCVAMTRDKPSVFHTAIIELLIRNGGNVNAQDEFMMTPLHWAAEQGYYPIAERLMANKANPLMRDEDGDVAMTCAQNNGHTSVVKLIQKYLGTLPTGEQLPPIITGPRKSSGSANTEWTDNTMLGGERVRKHRIDSCSTFPASQYTDVTKTPSRTPTGTPPKSSSPTPVAN